MDQQLTFEQFMRRTQDDVSRFRVMVLRALGEHPDLYPEKMSQRDWLKQFLLFLRKERPAKPRPRSSDVTRVRSR